MLLTKEQLSEQIRKYAEKKNGLHDLMEIMTRLPPGVQNASSHLLTPRMPAKPTRSPRGRI